MCETDLLRLFITIDYILGRNNELRISQKSVNDKKRKRG